MNWDTLDLRELGQPSCGACGGTGGRLTKTGRWVPVIAACGRFFERVTRGFGNA